MGGQGADLARPRRRGPGAPRHRALDRADRGADDDRGGVAALPRHAGQQRGPVHRRAGARGAGARGVRQGRGPRGREHRAGAARGDPVQPRPPRRVTRPVREGTPGVHGVRAPLPSGRGPRQPRLELFPHGRPLRRGALVPPGDRARPTRSPTSRRERPTAPSSASSSCGPTGGRRLGRTSSPPGGPAWKSARPSSPWTPQPGSASGWWSTASPRRTSSSTPGPSPPTPTSTRSVPRTPGRRCWRSAYALLATGDAARLDEADEAASRAGEVLGGSGVETAVPQCDVLRLAIARARGLDPSAGRRRRRGDRRSARPTGRRRLHAPAVRAGRALGRPGRRWSGPRAGGSAGASPRPGLRGPAGRRGGGTGDGGRLPRRAVGRPTGPAARRVLTWTSTWVSPAAETSPRASTASCARRSATDASVRATGFHRPAIWPPSSSCHGGR